MKIAFIIILILHSGIHLIGFSKEYWLLGTQNFSALSRSPGIVWLLSSIVLVGTATLFGINYNYWWIFGLISVLLSQAIIFITWEETKFGSTVNILLLIISIIAFMNH